MDELEISGKRYISTRRAAREHKYSSDYIGQLIRGKKVVGQKVGRSWYIDEDSLRNYLNGENVEVVKVVEVEEKVETKVEEVVPIKQIEVKAPRKEVSHISIPKELEEKVLEENKSRAHYIPINIKNKKGLTYIADDNPTLPVLEKKSRVRREKLPAMAEVVSEEEQIIERQFVPIKPSTSSPRGTLARVFIASGVGIFIFAALLVTSVVMGTLIVVEEGKPTTRHFTLP